jgi:hypothetical protein
VRSDLYNEWLERRIRNPSPGAKAPPAKKSRGELIAIFLVFLAGCAVLGYGLSELKKSMAASYWPATPGSIQECKVVARSVFVDEAPTEEYSAEVKYSYPLDGRKYEREYFAYAYDGSDSERASQDLCTQLPIGRSIQVRYDPNDHNEAFLGWGPSRRMIVTIYLAAWLLLVSCLGFLDRVHWHGGLLEKFRLDLVLGGERLAVVMFFAFWFNHFFVQRIYLLGPSIH